MYFQTHKICYLTCLCQFSISYICPSTINPFAISDWFEFLYDFHIYLNRKHTLLGAMIAYFSQIQYRNSNFEENWKIMFVLSLLYEWEVHYTAIYELLSIFKTFKEVVMVKVNIYEKRKLPLSTSTFSKLRYVLGYVSVFISPCPKKLWQRKPEFARA